MIPAALLIKNLNSISFPLLKGLKNKTIGSYLNTIFGSMANLPNQSSAVMVKQSLRVRFALYVERPTSTCTTTTVEKASFSVKSVDKLLLQAKG